MPTKSADVRVIELISRGVGNCSSAHFILSIDFDCTKVLFCAIKDEKRRSLLRIPQEGPYLRASKTISRVLYLTVIYLDVLLPARSSHPGSGRANLYAPIPVLLRIEFTASRCSHVMGELLPRLSTLTVQSTAVYLCCTFPRVAPGGCYPLSLPCGARTFLIDGPFAPPTRLSSLLAQPL